VKEAATAAKLEKTISAAVKEKVYAELSASLEQDSKTIMEDTTEVGSRT
jgi:hypothetical protein